jgi:hypothetical protein
VDPITLETVRAHEKEIRENDSARAAKVADDEARAAAAAPPPPAGPAPTPAQLAGTWEFDADATAEGMTAGLGTDLRQKTRARLDAGRLEGRDAAASCDEGPALILGMSVFRHK